MCHADCPQVKKSVAERQALYLFFQFCEARSILELSKVPELGDLPLSHLISNTVSASVLPSIKCLRSQNPPVSAAPFHQNEIGLLSVRTSEHGLSRAPKCAFTMHLTSSRSRPLTTWTFLSKGVVFVHGAIGMSNITVNSSATSTAFHATFSSIETPGRGSKGLCLFHVLYIFTAAPLRRWTLQHTLIPSTW